MNEKLVSRKIFHNGQLFDSIKGKIINDQTLVIIGNEISWVGPSNQFSKDEGDEIIDVTDKIILPGLIDCHVHLEAIDTPNYERLELRTKTPMYHYIALKHGQEHLKAGFTTVRDCGSWSSDWAPSLRKAFTTDMFPGPRLLIATRTIGQWGNQEATGPDYYIKNSEKWETLSGTEGVMHAVRTRKRLGADFIKTMTTGGVLHGQESQLDRSLWRDEELSAMVDEAHRLGMHVAVHAHGLHGIIKAAKAPVDTIEHCSFVDEEAADLMKSNDVYLVPTQISAFMDKPDLMKELPLEVQKKTIEVDSAMFVNHKMAFERGVKIAMGTDAGVPGNPHGTSAREITSYVKIVEMSPEQAIQSATSIAAQAIKLDDRIGSLEKGKLADLVVVNKNPIENIQVLEDITNLDCVVKNGRILVQKGKLL